MACCTLATVVSDGGGIDCAFRKAAVALITSWLVEVEVHATLGMLGVSMVLVYWEIHTRPKVDGSKKQINRGQNLATRYGSKFCYVQPHGLGYFYILSTL